MQSEKMSNVMLYLCGGSPQTECKMKKEIRKDSFFEKCVYFCKNNTWIVMDKLSPQQRHKNMAAIRSKDTKPEWIVRRGLWKRGFRYRLNAPRLPGHPDLVLRKYRTCIFVNGCFWHGHNVTFPEMKNDDIKTLLDGIENSACCKIPRTNREFWVRKIQRNQERDIEQQHRLARLGWHCITIWECSLKPSIREQTLTSLAYTLNHIWLEDHGAKVISYPSSDDEEMRMPRAAEEETEYGGI